MQLTLDAGALVYENEFDIYYLPGYNLHESKFFVNI